MFNLVHGSVWRNWPNLCWWMFWILREPLDVYERPFGVWRLLLLALPLVGFGSLENKKANPPMRKIDTSVNVARSNQTNTSDTTNTTNPIVVVFQLRKIRSSIIFYLSKCPGANAKSYKQGTQSSRSIRRFVKFGRLKSTPLSRTRSRRRVVRIRFSLFVWRVVLFKINCVLRFPSREPMHRRTRNRPYD